MSERPEFGSSDDDNFTEGWIALAAAAIMAVGPLINFALFVKKARRDGATRATRRYRHMDDGDLHPLTPGSTRSAPSSSNSASASTGGGDGGHSRWGGRRATVNPAGIRPAHEMP